MAGGRALTPLDTVVVVVLIDVAIVIAATTFWPIHQSPALLIAVAAALAAGTVIAVLGATLRWNTLTVGSATVLAYLLLGVPVAVPGEALFGVLPTVPGLGRLLAGTALSWKELLTISLPVGDYEALLVPAFLLVLLTCVLSLTVALRARWGELAVLGPALVFVTGILFGPVVAWVPLPGALALLVVALVYLVWRRARRRSEAIRLLNEQAGTPVEARVDRRVAGIRTAASVAVILSLALGGAVAASAALPPEGQREVLRSSIEKPFDPRDYPSPLSAFRRYFQPPTAEDTMLTVQGLEEGELIRLATLDSYDGVIYTVGSDTVTSASGTFTRVPFALDQGEERGRSARVEFRIAGYAGVWVPDVGALERVEFDGPRAAELERSFYYNANSGTAAVLAGLREGDRYTMEAVVGSPLTDEEIAALDPGQSPVPEPAVVPEDVRSAAMAYSADREGAGNKLLSVIEGLRRDGYVSHGVGDEPFSRSGHSADRITRLLTEQPMLGDAEQYAVTAALMAHSLGFPSRVVLGFAVPAGAAENHAPVVGADLTAWIEVSSAGGGWVAIDPNPPVREIPEAQPEEATKVARPQSVVPPPQEERIDPDEVTPPDVAEEEQDPPVPLWLSILLAVLGVLGWILLIVAVLSAPFLAVIAAKWQRRRRRRTVGTPLERIGGGWAEFTDAAADYGYDPAPEATRYEVAMAVGGRQPLVLAAAVDRATFGPGTPEEVDVDRVWRSVTDLRGSMHEQRTRWERIKALVSIRSFVRNRELARKKEGHRS